MGVAAAVAAAPGFAAEPVPVTTSGGFYGVAHREIQSSGTAKAMVYSVLGALTLTMPGRSPIPLSAECLGFDEHGEGTPTIGVGRCAWKDGDNHAIFVSIATEGDRNVYRVTGGTGKWEGTQGEIRTSFTYLPAPEGTLLLQESGSGRIVVPRK